MWILARYIVHNNRNYTIGTDRWSIQPLSNCFWKTNLINLNRKTFHWEHNASRLDSAYAKYTHTKFKSCLAVWGAFAKWFWLRFEEYPAHSVTYLERLNVLNEFIDKIEETHDNSLTGIIMSEKQDIKIGDIYSWTDYLRIVVFTTIGFIMFILIAYIFARFNTILAMIDSFQQRRNHRLAVEIPVEQMHHMRYAANNPVLMSGNMYPFGFVQAHLLSL